MLILHKLNCNVNVKIQHNQTFFVCCVRGGGGGGGGGESLYNATYKVSFHMSVLRLPQLDSSSKHSNLQLQIYFAT